VLAFPGNIPHSYHKPGCQAFSARSLGGHYREGGGSESVSVQVVLVYFTEMPPCPLEMYGREAIGELVYQSQSSRIEVILRDELVEGRCRWPVRTGVAVPAMDISGQSTADGPFLGKATAPPPASLDGEREYGLLAWRGGETGLLRAPKAGRMPSG